MNKEKHHNTANAQAELLAKELSSPEGLKRLGEGAYKEAQKASKKIQKTGA